MKLYNFWRSGTSHRTRIALNLKGLDTEYVAVHLAKEEHLKDEFKAVNPQQLVPALHTGSEVLIQSPAIIEWLEEKYPSPSLLPRDPVRRAQVRAAGVAWCAGFGRIGGIGGPMLGSALITAGLPLDVIFYILAGLALLGVGLSLLVPLSRSAQWRLAHA